MTPFGSSFQSDLETLFRRRRDVRHFRSDPVEAGLLAALLDMADLAPSVGLSQPWRFVLVDRPDRRALVRGNFERANRQALAGQTCDRAALYAGLKLSGLDRAPCQIAVFADQEPCQGHGLGRATMPETLGYSAALAIHTLWLAAASRGLGLGWVSILDPGPMNADLDVPADWRFIAYLCLGYPREASDIPELERQGWETRSAASQRIVRR